MLTTALFDLRAARRRRSALPPARCVCVWSCRFRRRRRFSSLALLHLSSFRALTPRRAGTACFVVVWVRVGAAGSPRAGAPRGRRACVHQEGAVICSLCRVAFVLDRPRVIGSYPIVCTHFCGSFGFLLTAKCDCLLCPFLFPRCTTRCSRPRSSRTRRALCSSRLAARLALSFLSCAADPHTPSAACSLLL